MCASQGEDKMTVLKNAEKYQECGTVNLQPRDQFETVKIEKLRKWTVKWILRAIFCIYSWEMGKVPEIDWSDIGSEEYGPECVLVKW